MAPFVDRPAGEVVEVVYSRPCNPAAAASGHTARGDNGTECKLRGQARHLHHKIERKNTTMRTWLFYTQLAVQDLVRLWGATQHHVIIVAGICLPILLLLGLERGHVADLRRDLLTSPTGRQIVFWSAQQGDLLDREAISRP